jgi:hypothetical protein
MTKDSSDLKSVVESQHSYRATLTQGQPVWEGVVHVFDLEEHPQATGAYAWSSTIDGSDKRRYYAVLGIGAIKTPLDAVRAAIVAEHQKG